MSVEPLTQRLEDCVRRELPSLNDEQARELAVVLERLIAHLQPEQIYVFGSQARHEVTPDSDVDLLIIISHSDKPRYERAQDAFLAVGLHDLALDILIFTRDEFERRRAVPASLPATVLREGKVLYAA